jgi:hypothetical protein
MCLLPKYLVEVLLQENQENIDHAPLRGDVGRAQASRNVWSDQTPVPEMSVTEDLRHLAGRYLDNPDSQVRLVRLEMVPSGQFQVVIILEMAGTF